MVSEPVYHAEKWERKRVDYVAGMAMFSTGIILTFLRLYEPFFLFLIKRFTFNCFGIVVDMEEAGVQTKTLSTFLASSLNVELVHIILKGIKKFSNIRMHDLEPSESEGSELGS